MRPVETLVLGCLVLTAAAAQDSGESLYRANAPKFHQNFSAGNFEANGSLVTEDIDVDSNNVKFVGRENFVKRIERYSIPFPGMQLRDRVIVVDGNIAAVNYYLQGEHKGPYGKYPATGNRIEAMSGEVFEFNPQGLMKKLTTITELDRVEAEIKGTIKIAAFADITLLPNAEAQSSERAKLRATAAKFDRNVNEGHGAANAKLAVPDVRINADGKALKGRAALIEQRERLKRAFADLHIEDEYVLIDGRRAAVEYVMTGTQTGPWTMPDGSVLAPTHKKVRVRGIDFLSFDQSGLLEELVIVHNEADFATQLRP
jgi:predicted ester cyclase